MTQTNQLTPAKPADVKSVGGLASYTPEQQQHLLRLARLDALRRQEVPKLDPSDWRVRLVHKALYSVYRDCEEAGVGEEARRFTTRPTA